MVSAEKNFKSRNLWNIGLTKANKNPDFCEVNIMFTAGILLQLLVISIVISDPNPLAEPKSFTDDPYVDDEKFREKGKWNTFFSFMIKDDYKMHFFSILLTLIFHLFYSIVFYSYFFFIGEKCKEYKCEMK